MGLIGAGLGGLLGGIAGLFAGPAPTYKSASFNNQVDLDELKSRAARTPEELQRMQMEGTGDAAVMQGSPEQVQTERTALGNASGADVSDALARRSQRQFGNSLATLHRQSQIDSVNKHYGQVDTAHQMEQAKTQLDLYQRQLEQQADREQEAARYSVLGNLLQGVGNVVGTGVANLMKPPTPNTYDKGVQAGTNFGPNKAGM